jgi:hypothetical protein
MSKQEKSRQQLACDYIQSNYVAHDRLRYDLVAQKVQLRDEIIGAPDEPRGFVGRAEASTTSTMMSSSVNVGDCRTRWRYISNADINSMVCDCCVETGANVTSKEILTVLNAGQQYIPRVHPLREYILALPDWTGQVDWIDFVAQQVRVTHSVESCRMVQNGVESSSAENTMLPNATQPLHNATAHRTGIRIHAGNTIEHTTGCILVGDLACLENGGDAASTSLIASSPLASSPDRLLSSRRRLEELRTYLLNYIKQNPYEEIYIQLESPDPYPDADTPCNYEQQQHIQESLQRAHRLREERR